MLSTASLAKTPSHNIELVGSNPLFGRGMNAALAMYDHYIYIGNRTDSSATCVGATGMPAGNACPHPHPGILIVNIKNPAEPTIAGEIGKPYAGNAGVTTRELRVWPQKKLLIVMNFHCSHVIHACQDGTDKDFPFDLSFFDLGDPLKPKFLSRYVPTSLAGRQVKPHEMFLWIDPANRDRALLYLSTPSGSIDQAVPNLVVADISRVNQGSAATEVAEGNWNALFPGTGRADYPTAANHVCGPYDCNLFVHSVSVSDDGRRTYLSMEAGHFLILDTAAVAKANPGHVISLNAALITQPVNRPVWGQTPADARAIPVSCRKACANAHSAVKVPGRPLLVTTDEVYGTFTDPKYGCPWGWEHLINISDETHPSIVGRFKISQDTASFCGSASDDALTEQYTSYSSHNPTVLRDLAIISWHSGGLQITDIRNASRPVAAGFFSPSPLATVATEDPALTRGPNKVAFWSYPVIRNGLIYVIDVRNGLYVLRYTGPQAQEVRNTKFLEGNSNLGDGH